jgi:probable rRNA maturation factor
MPLGKPQIVVQIADHFGRLQIEKEKIEELVKTVCRRFDLSRATVSIAVVDDERFSELNLRFRKSKSLSDCLSFDLSEGPETDAEKLFELVVNGQMAIREAELRNHSSQAELALYITHGLLHNLGFDDATPQGRREMHDTEDEILDKLGYGFVYNTPINKEEPGQRTDT